MENNALKLNNNKQNTCIFINTHTIHSILTYLINKIKKSKIILSTNQAKQFCTYLIFVFFVCDAFKYDEKYTWDYYSPLISSTNQQTDQTK